MRLQLYRVRNVRPIWPLGPTGKCIANVFDALERYPGCYGILGFVVVAGLAYPHAWIIAEDGECFEVTELPVGELTYLTPARVFDRDRLTEYMTEVARRLPP